MKQFSRFLGFSFLVVAFALSGCEKAQEESQVLNSGKTVDVQVETVQLGTIPLVAVVPGSVVPEQKASIASRLLGYIQALDVQVGQTVKQGELLFSIDSADIKSQINQANAAYKQALAGLKDAKLDYHRFRKLYQEESVSKQQFDKMRLQYSVAQQNVAAAKSSLNQAKEQLHYANVKAPFDGVVVEKLAVAGDLAAPGKPILVIENASSLSVQTEVAGELFAVLRLGDEVQIVLDGQPKPFMGTVYTLVGAANPKTRTHTVKLSLPENLNVNSGTFARVSFKRGTRQTMMVPKTAIVNRADIEGVFVMKEGRASFHMVRLGAEIGEMIEVLSGLALGEKIVVSNTQTLLNGDRLNKIESVNDASEKEGVL
ncbi:Efflux transporter, RND family, MFP subunit, AcrA/E family [hydrothermal vent metagenome]|uniref:Efflux transporter, RND family, MFP subunit, AcrA/E family n=1 Tax=hydrothermal vent metagenome TaxID=652676 RepID=A0A3B0WEV8_9ZZZZ